VTMFPHQELDQLIATYGYLAVTVGVGLESMGLPLPGETILVLAAMYAASHADLNIWLVGERRWPGPSWVTTSATGSA
jgi:membrane protein DedA with SNARE-associated domain